MKIACVDNYCALPINADTTDQQCPRKLVHHISKTMNKNVNSVGRKGDWYMESGVILSEKKKEKPDYSCPK